jgi:hypothetical protein
VTYVATAFAAVTVTVNGSNHTIPQTGEKGWGTNVTAWIQAISQNTLQPSGGTFTLTADANFGADYGLVSSYFKSRTSNIATSGILRLANSDKIGFRNTANDGNLLLGVDSSDRLTFNGSAFLPTAALTASRALASDASGVVSVSAVTSTELGYVSGVTSAIQTQLNAAATDADLSAHEADTTSIHGITDTSTLLTTDNSKTVTGKTIDADDNTISDIDNGEIKASAAIALNKLAAATASRALVSDASGFITASATTSTELGYVSGVTSAIQTQINNISSAALSTVSRDTTDTVDSTESVVFLTASGGAWTSTLYTASGNTGKVVRFIKTGNNGTAVTIDGNSTETIGGVLTIQLVNIGDFLVIVSDGTNWQILDSRITSQARYHTDNGYGSTNNKIKKFTTEVTNVGNAMTVVNDATNGASATINLPGTYCFSLSNSANGNDAFGFSLNSAQLTTGISAITTADRLVFSNTGAADFTYSATWCGSLKNGDVVRPHANGSSASTVPERASFSAARIN